MAPVEAFRVKPAGIAGLMLYEVNTPPLEAGVSTVMATPLTKTAVGCE
jgi:hypothetical protein